MERSDDLQPDDFDPRRKPRSFYERKIRALSEEHKALMTAGEEVSRELQWWQTGLEQFAPASDESPEQIVIQEAASADGSESVPRVVIPPHSRPVLKAAIAMVLNDGELRRPAEVIQALEARGWLPQAKSAHQMVRNRMLDMLGDKELVKDEDGRYTLAPDIQTTGLLRVDPAEDAA